MFVHSLCMYSISAHLIHTWACLKINPSIIFLLSAELKWLSLKCHWSPIALEDRSVFKLSTKRLMLVISPIIWQPWCGLECRYSCDQCYLTVPLTDGSPTHAKTETKLCWKALINGVSTCDVTVINKASFGMTLLLGVLKHSTQCSCNSAGMIVPELGTAHAAQG